MRSQQPLYVAFILSSCLVLGAFAASCVRRPATRDTGRMPLITSDDPRAEAELREARLLAEQGNPDVASVRYEAFIRMRASDPLAPVARLELGRIHLDQGDVSAARDQFAEVAVHTHPHLAERGRFYLGIAMHLAGEHAHAIATLRPFVDRTVDPDDTLLLLPTLARSLERDGQYPEALTMLDKLFGGAMPEDARSEAKGLAERITVDLATPEDIERAYGELPQTGLVWRMVARRALREADAAGRIDRTREILGDLEHQGVQLDETLQEIAFRAARPEHADPHVIGAILTLSGRARRIGELALQGVMLSAGLPDGPSGADAPRVVFRDDGGDPERAVQAVEELVTLHRAIAILGPLHARTAIAAARRAQELGVPIITLTPTPEITSVGSMVFRLFHTPEDEASALVENARQRGARRFAILHPQSAYGDVLRDAFVRAVARHGGSVAAVESYAPNATSFGTPVAELRRTPFDALFVADASERVALIAPALAAGGLWSARPSAVTPRGTQSVVLLVPSVGFSRALARTSGRYLQGALFATGFDAASAAPATAAFIAQFEQDFAMQPDAFAAFAFDGYALLRRTIAEGARTRADLAYQLSYARNPEAVTASEGFTIDRVAARGVQVLEFRDDVFVPID